MVSSKRLRGERAANTTSAELQMGEERGGQRKGWGEGINMVEPA